MIDKAAIRLERIPDSLLSSLDTRDVALWVRTLPRDRTVRDALAKFLALPWRLVLVETYDPDLFAKLESDAASDAAMTRKRGFIQVLDTDPSRIELPQRCLPLYLLNGREGAATAADFESRLRRLTMLEALRRSAPRDILVLSGAGAAVPPELQDLCAAGFRPFLTLASDVPGAADEIDAWLRRTDGVATATVLSLSTAQVVDDVLARYAAIYPEDRRVVRIRDRSGTFRRVDVTAADEPERPILESYSLVEERDLKPLTPEELSEETLVEFFRNPEASWRPYAAGLPWLRDPTCKADLLAHLRKLDADGPEANRVVYVASESGAGGTTFVRALAWECASQGYPVLVAKPLPFVPDALAVANFLKRVHDIADAEKPAAAATPVRDEVAPPADRAPGRYETPWLIVFDCLHWQYRDSELLRFRNEMEKSGRPVCVMVATPTLLGLSFYNASVFKRLAELNHAISSDDARDLGHHLNRFLRVYGKHRSEEQWQHFYKDHTVRSLDGLAAFWVTLSFWIQGQYDLTESIQQWMYRAFKTNAADRTMQVALLEIAALSSERLPLPEALLPPSAGRWPLSHLLEDARSSLAALGLVRITANGEKHWALIHDVLGRLLINALFYDFPVRQELGFGDATDAEHLRFLLLRQISHKPALGERLHRPMGEEFATSIFKVDPDHGHGSFAALWREVLAALDAMPRSLRDTSRLFRHHTAVSRRRIATFDEEFFGVTPADKQRLLTQAIDDINYALTVIEPGVGGESNLNLYNSLANAYFDLERLEATRGAPRERVHELRRLANEATRRAYDESPTNSFVIETFVKNLLQSAADAPDHAVAQCVEALGILFSALGSQETAHRAPQLGALADQALRILFKQAPPPRAGGAAGSAVDVLVMAWTALAEGYEGWSSLGLADVPEANRLKALAILEDPAGRGNMQVLRLSYDLTAVARPHAFKRQLELVEELHATDYRMTPQLRLEYAILLFQSDRAAEGEKVFRSLRVLWRDSEHSVYVPERLRWLRSADATTLQTVHAVVGSDQGYRAMARVQKFGNALVPFRPEEHGIREARPGTRFSCHVSFGHNGPFLRPVTAHPAKATGG